MASVAAPCYHEESRAAPTLPSGRCGAGPVEPATPARTWHPHAGCWWQGYRMRSRRASAELMMGFPLCSVSSFWAAPPGWMMETMTMPTMTATKVVHR